MSGLLLDYARRYRGRFLVGLAFTAVGTSFGLATPWLLRQAIDGITHQEGGLGWPLQAYALAIVGVALLEALGRFCARLLITGGSRMVEYDLRNRYFAHLETLEAAFFQQYRTGDLVARATNDLSAVRQLFGPAFYNVLNTLILVSISVVLMFQISRVLALWATFILPLSALFFVFTRKRIEQRFTRVQEQFAAMSDHAQETFSGERVVKAYAQEAAEIETFRRTSQEYVRRQLSQIRLTGFLWPSMTLLGGLLTVVLLYVGGREVVEQRLTLGEFVQFSAYAGGLAWPMMGLSWVATMWQQGSASLRRIDEVLSRRPSIAGVEGSDGAFDPPSTPAVELRNVSLEIGDRELLHDVSIVVPAGATVALVGPLGSGKSLLLGLVTRQLDATNGQVLVGGVDVRDWPLTALRRLIGYVPQETFLFSGSLRENVGFGLDAADATEGRIQEAVRLSRLENDLDQWPTGLEAVIGERGVTLSGGQKQRTAIARAVAKDPSILILDDALSSVDTRTEATILEGLRAFMRHRTSLVVAHRVSTVRAADLIVVLRDGRIAEQGTHAELVAAGGWYARTYRRQLIAEELEVEDEERPDVPALDGQDGRVRSPRLAGWGEG